jgi:hypothetical protein
MMILFIAKKKKKNLSQIVDKTIEACIFITHLITLRIFETKSS